MSFLDVTGSILLEIIQLHAAVFHLGLNEVLKGSYEIAVINGISIKCLHLSMRQHQLKRQIDVNLIAAAVVGQDTVSCT